MWILQKRWKANSWRHLIVGCFGLIVALIVGCFGGPLVWKKITFFLIRFHCFCFALRYVFSVCQSKWLILMHLFLRMLFWSSATLCKRKVTPVWGADGPLMTYQWNNAEHNLRCTCSKTSILYLSFKSTTWLQKSDG